jgi:hypothetical protein
VKFFSPLLAALILCPVVAAAQVTMHPAALAQLAGIPAHPVHHRHHHRIHVAKIKILAPTLVVARPPAVLPPPPHPAPPPPARPAAAASPPPPPPPPPPAPLTLAFAPGSAALPANAAGALKPFCKTAGVIGISARAPGDPSDPSVAMRLSLARALAVRDALTACGVPAQNILPRALGSVPGQNEDETVLGLEK